MNDTLTELKQRVLELEAEFENKLEEQRARFHYELVNRRARFERDVLEAHRQLKTNWLRFVSRVRLSTLITLPFIYGLSLPLLLLDLAVSLYQAVCFPIYGIQRVKRGDHIVIDRHQLAYLNAIEKLNCLYCGYANGLIAYVREIASRTEQFWCPIKHARRTAAPHDRYWQFSDYGDAEGYWEQLKALRAAMKPGGKK